METPWWITAGLPTRVGSAQSSEHRGEGYAPPGAALLPVSSLAMAAASALADGPPFRWEVPRAIASADVPGEQVALGVPLRLSAVRSQLDAESLFDFFLREFEKADFFVAPRTLQFSPPGGLSLTGLDVKRGVSYTVIFQPNPDKTTTVILGEAGPPRRKPRGAPSRCRCFRAHEGSSPRRTRAPRW